MSNGTTPSKIITVTKHQVPEDFNNIIETLSVIKLLLMFFTITLTAILIIVVVIKLTKACKKIYNLHNEIVIRRHNRITPEL